MSYQRGDSKQIIVGAAAMFVSTSGEFEPDVVAMPDFEYSGGKGVGYQETLTDWEDVRNVGYTMNGLEIQFQPDFGEVQVDQLLDVARLYKQGMQVNLNTAFAEATLENLLVAIAGPESDYDADALIDNPLDESGTKAQASVMNLSSGAIGECPVERGLVAVGPGTGNCDPGEYVERIYVAYRALSIDSVTVSAKRDEPSMFEVSFRLLPANNGSYGKIVDRTIAAPAGS
jgi:hypothetical protein